jgi:hypothetical protein
MALSRLTTLGRFWTFLGHSLVTMLAVINPAVQASAQVSPMAEIFRLGVGIPCALTSTAVGAVGTAYRIRGETVSEGVAGAGYATGILSTLIGLHALVDGIKRSGNDGTDWYVIGVATTFLVVGAFGVTGAALGSNPPTKALSVTPMRLQPIRGISFGGVF